MLTAVHHNRLTLDRLIELMSTNPRRIFHLPPQPDTLVEVETDAVYTIQNKNLYTKCGWTPFDGQEVRGRVEKVILEGRTVYENGRVTAEPGTGQMLTIDADFEETAQGLITTVPAQSGDGPWVVRLSVLDGKDRLLARDILKVTSR
jgi:carbamoyl-phosphate synthase/aspartate carbamoyltransferase/dihydroorotase